MENTIVGGIVSERGLDEGIDASKDVEVHVEGLGELACTNGCPCLDVNVAEGLREGLYAEAGLAIAQTAIDLEGSEGEGDERFEWGIGKDPAHHEAVVRGSAVEVVGKVAVTS